MDNIRGFSKEHLQLSPDVPVAVRQLVQQAIDCYDDRAIAEPLFKQALALAPSEMEIYVAFYKFYFYQKYLEEAEQMAQQTLDKIAELTGLPSDWRNLPVESAHWVNPDSPVRYYLYTMKALAFIALRREHINLAHEILDKLMLLDPEDRVGGSVILALANRIANEES